MAMESEQASAALIRGDGFRLLTRDMQEGR